MSNPKKNKLQFSKNSKTLRGDYPAYSFAIPAGYTCPGANICKTFANRDNGKLTKGKEQVFNCYAAKIESIYSAARNVYWNNYDILRACNDDTDEMADKLLQMVDTLPCDSKYFRVHSGGDFFSDSYTAAWYKVAEQRENIVFYGYTKTLMPFRLDARNNWRWTYSHGGKHDDEAQTLGLPTCYVITKSNQEQYSHITIDNTDSDDFAKLQNGTSHFGLKLH